MNPTDVPTTGASYYNALEYMCSPCYGSAGVNECVYGGGPVGRFDPRDAPLVPGNPFVSCQPDNGVYTNCYFPEADKMSTDACSTQMFDQGMASSMARRQQQGGQGQGQQTQGQGGQQTSRSLAALASLAAQRQKACPNYLCKNDQTYKGEKGRASFAKSSCACVNAPVAASLQQGKK